MSGTTVVSVVVEIDAPQALVWEVVTDFAAYSAWNPFTVQVDTTGGVGDDVVLHLPDPAVPGALFTTVETIRVVAAPHHLQYDTGSSIPGMLAVRDQWVRDLGEGRSSYATTDAFSGEIAQVVYDLQADWVKAGFDAVAHALKARAEQLHAARR